MGSAPGGAANYRLTLRAVPNSVPADGASTVQITAEVLGESDQPADGVEVQFATTAGVILPYATTRNGQATVTLTSATYATVAMVTANVAGAVATAQVAFGELADQEGPPVLRVKGGFLDYSVDEQRLYASEGVKLEYRGLTIRAQQIQVDQVQGLIRAQGDVLLQRGEQKLTGDELSYRWEGNRGVLVRLGDQIEQVSFQGENLQPSSSGGRLSGDATAPLQPSNSRTWVTADRVTLFPRDKIQFSHATVFVNDLKIMSVPHYYVSLSNRRDFLNQQMRYTTTGGITFDLPYYLRVAHEQTTAVKLRYASKGSSYGGSYSPRRGWSLGLEQQYSVGGEGEGRVFIDAFTDSQRSLEWTHQQEFDRRSRGYLSLRYQPQSSYARQNLNGYLNFYSQADDYRFNFSASGSSSQIPSYSSSPSAPRSYRSMSYLNAQGTWTGRPMPLGKSKLSYAWGATLGYGQGGSGGISLYRSPGRAVSSLRNEPDFFATMEEALSPETWLLGKDTWLSLDLQGSLTRSFSGRQSNLWQTDLSLRHRLGRTGNLNLRYSYSHETNPRSYYRPSEQQLSMNLFFSTSRLYSYAYTSYGLDDQRFSFSTQARYKFREKWNLEGQHTFSRSSYQDYLGNQRSSGYQRTEISVVRDIGAYEISLNWSPEGRSYGRGGSKLWFEIGANSF